MRWPHLALILASAVALMIGLSLSPMRWYARGALLAGGLAIGTGALWRAGWGGGIKNYELRIKKGEEADAERSGRDQAAAGGGRLLKQVCFLVLWSEIIGLTLRYLGQAAALYVGFDEASYGRFWPYRMLLIAHILGGTLTVVLGPFQFWTGLRRRAMRVHRWTGRLYVFGVVLAASAAYRLGYLIDPVEGGLRAGLSMMCLATVWLIATGMALRAISRGRVELHQEWMIRSYVLALAFVTIRFLSEIPAVVRLGTPAEVVPPVIWAAWALPLFFAEVAMQWRRTGRG